MRTYERRGFTECEPYIKYDPDGLAKYKAMGITLHFYSKKL